jgi:hypothetical protein
LLDFIAKTVQKHLAELAKLNTKPRPKQKKPAAQMLASPLSGDDEAGGAAPTTPTSRMKRSGSGSVSASSSRGSTKGRVDNDNMAGLSPLLPGASTSSSSSAFKTVKQTEDYQKKTEALRKDAEEDSSDDDDWVGKGSQRSGPKKRKREEQPVLSASSSDSSSSSDEETKEEKKKRVKRMKKAEAKKLAKKAKKKKKTEKKSGRAVKSRKRETDAAVSKFTGVRFAIVFIVCSDPMLNFVVWVQMIVICACCTHSTVILCSTYSILPRHCDQATLSSCDGRQR